MFALLEEAAECCQLLAWPGNPGTLLLAFSQRGHPSGQEKKLNRGFLHLRQVSKLLWAGTWGSLQTRLDLTTWGGSGAGGGGTSSGSARGHRTSRAASAQPSLALMATDGTCTGTQGPWIM